MGSLKERMAHDEMEGNNEEMKTPIVASVQVIGEWKLRITWENQTHSEIDLAEMVREDPALDSLRSPASFRKARVGLWGHSVCWGKSIDIGADTLWTLAHEQSGNSMPADAFNAWLERNRISLSDAAKILGLSRRMIIYYHMGHRPIPRIVALACRGYESTLQEKAA